MAESCSQCGKEIPRRAVPRVFDDRIVCLGCWRQLDAGHRKATASPCDDSPTERQVAYARHLGIDVPSSSTKESLSRLIADQVNPLLTPDQIAECHSLGIAATATHRVEDVQDCLRDRQRARTWVYSVCRHMHGTNWLQFSDSQLPDSVVVEIAVALAEQQETMEQIWEQDEGWSDDFDGLVQDLAEVLGTGDATLGTPQWFFFNREGANSRCKAYRATKELVEERLGPNLMMSPKHISYVKLARQGNIEVRPAQGPAW